MSIAIANSDNNTFTIYCSALKGKIPDKCSSIKLKKPFKEILFFFPGQTETEKKHAVIAELRECA